MTAEPIDLSDRAKPTEARIPVLWQPRSMPLVPAAVVAVTDACCRALRGRLLARDDTDLSALTGVFGTSLLLLIGASEDLPWADGALYLGRDPNAPGVLLPTTHAPSVPVPLLVRALQVQFPTLTLPFAVLRLDTGSLVVPLADARAVTRQRLLSGRKASD